jgi:hypothetical protein
MSRAAAPTVSFRIPRASSASGSGGSPAHLRLQQNTWLNSGDIALGFGSRGMTCTARRLQTAACLREEECAESELPDPPREFCVRE